MKKLEEKLFLCLWDSDTYIMAGHKKVYGSFFNDENGYNENDKEALNELEMFEILPMASGHYIQRIH